MRALRFGKHLWQVIIAALMLALCSVPALAQCAMCRAAFNDGTSNGAAMAQSLNRGIIVLLIPPVAIFCAIFITAIKYKKAADDNPKKTL